MNPENQDAIIPNSTQINLLRQSLESPALIETLAGVDQLRDIEEYDIRRDITFNFLHTQAKLIEHIGFGKNTKKSERQEPLNLEALPAGVKFLSADESGQIVVAEPNTGAGCLIVAEQSIEIENEIITAFLPLGAVRAEKLRYPVSSSDHPESLSAEAASIDDFSLLKSIPFIKPHELGQFIADIKQALAEETLTVPAHVIDVIERFEHLENTGELMAGIEFEVSELGTADVFWGERAAPLAEALSDIGRVEPELIESMLEVATRRLSAGEVSETVDAVFAALASYQAGSGREIVKLGVVPLPASFFPSPYLENALRPTMDGYAKNPDLVNAVIEFYTRENFPPEFIEKGNWAVHFNPAAIHSHLEILGNLDSMLHEQLVPNVVQGGRRAVDAALFATGNLMNGKLHDIDQRNASFHRQPTGSLASNFHSAFSSAGIETSVKALASGDFKDIARSFMVENGNPAYHNAVFRPRIDQGSLELTHRGMTPDKDLIKASLQVDEFDTQVVSILALANLDSSVLADLEAFHSQVVSDLDGASAEIAKMVNANANMEMMPVTAMKTQNGETVNLSALEFIELKEITLREVVNKLELALSNHELNGNTHALQSMFQRLVAIVPQVEDSLRLMAHRLKPAPVGTTGLDHWQSTPVQERWAIAEAVKIEWANLAQKHDLANANGNEHALGVEIMLQILHKLSKV